MSQTPSAVDESIGARSLWGFRRLELSTQILLSLTAGVACGIFFGPLCGVLGIVGDAFVGLLRMTVLPYIVVTLIASLGRLTLQTTGRLALIGGLVLLGLWGVCLTVIWILPSAFPDWESGSFFSTALVSDPAPTDLLAYFIPANIFEALTGNQVPAIVLFCIFCGLALSRVRRRELLLDQLDIAAETLMRISRTVAKFAPLGIFAISASTAGTVSLEEISRLQAYLFSYAAGAAFLGFLVLPLLITTVTPLSYRQVIRVVKEPMLTAFATGKLIVVLPMLVENTERLIRESNLIDGDDEAPSIELLYATAYPFPHVGKLLSLLFIPFAAWFLGSSLSFWDYPTLLFSGVFSYFGGPIVAIPFLLDQQQLPHDMFQLFLVSGVLGERIGDAVGAMHLCALTIISVFGFNRKLRATLWSILRYLVIISMVGLAMVGGVRVVLYRFISTAENRAEVLQRMQLIEQPVPFTVDLEGTANPDPLRPGESLLDRIARREKIRVGFNEDKVPFAFFNEEGTPVGYDVDMAHAFARDLGVEIEFVRFERETLVRQLQFDHFDVVMTGLVGTLERAQLMEHSNSYLDVNLALVSRDFRAHEFQSLKQIRANESVTIGYVGLSSGFVERAEHVLPNARFVEIRSSRDFFTGRYPELDLLLTSAESGSAFTLMYPSFEVIVPEKPATKLPLFYGIGQRDRKMADFLNHWIELRKKDGTAREYYEHWVLGKTDSNGGPRWSVIRDVLHWID